MTTNIACISVGLPGHGHNVSFAPNAIISIAKAVSASVAGISVRVFDQVIDGDGEEFYALLERYAPGMLLVSVPVTGYYDRALWVFRWARERDIPVLAGGFHFCVPSDSGEIPGIIAREAARREGIVVCYGDGEAAAIGFVRHSLDPIRYPMEAIPTVCYEKNGTISVSPSEKDTIGRCFPVLSLEAFDPRRYWRCLSESDARRSGHDSVGDVRIDRTAVAPRLIQGCLYRDARMQVGKPACGYCTLTAPLRRTRPEAFWEFLDRLWADLETVPWQGSPGVQVYHTGDDMGSDVHWLQSVMDCRPPEWDTSRPIGHRMYARHVASHRHAELLRDLGIYWLYIGADGKVGYVPLWSDRHPLVRTLSYCREVGISVSLGFVLGQYGQSWSDIERWLDFKRRIMEEFDDVLILVDGWVNLVAPGSSDWLHLCRNHPEFAETDRPDLEVARMRFWETCTRLCTEGTTPEQVRERLYRLVPEFERHAPKPRHFMLPH